MCNGDIMLIEVYILLLPPIKMKGFTCTQLLNLLVTCLYIAIA